MEPLLLLHGALGAADMFSGLKQELSGKYEVHTLDFSGHGTDDSPAPFSIPFFANDVLNYMQLNGLDKVSVFGYSMGGFVAVYLARHYAEKISKIVTLATKWEWNEAIAAKETGMLDTVKIEAKVPQLAAALQKRHIGKDWKELVNKTATMMLEMGQNNPLQPADFPEVPHPVTVLLGDRDKMVGLDETIAVYKQLPNGKMGMLPGTAHPLEQVDTVLLSQLIKHFI